MTTAAPVAVNVQLPPLHPSQQAIAKHPARFKVICCGRRYGKGVLGVTICLRKAAKGGRCWWVAPTYQIALEGWSYLLQLVSKFPGTKVILGEHIVRFPGGGSVQIKTGDNPDNLRGAGLDLVVLDEAATMKPDVWYLSLRPALADRQGEAVFISTPQHFNWFYDLYTLGETGQEDWASWQYPTWDNPFIPEAEIDAARRDMTDEDFDQEFGASFTAVGGAVFRLLSSDRHIYFRPMPAGLVFDRIGVGMDWGTTPAHNAAVVSGGRTTTGSVWIRSSWLDHSGSSDKWRDEAVRCKRDYGATFARVDRSQSSELDRLMAVGYAAETGLANVEARIGNAQSLIVSRNIFFDSNGPGMRDLYNHLCAYHRDRDGKIVEVEDDDVDGFKYLVSELVRDIQAGAPHVQTMTRTPTKRQFGGVHV